MWCALGCAAPSAAQTAASPAASAANAANASTAANVQSPAASSLPADYVVGPGDVLTILVYGRQDMSGDVVVRPDGKISLPILNDIAAGGHAPEALRELLKTATEKYVTDPDVTVMVKEVHSRNVFIQGMVAKPSSYPLMTQMDVMQLIAQAGGLLEYADKKNIVIIRTSPEGKKDYFKFNWDDVVKRKHPEQNITLKPFDQVVVP
jgi:polysaccharide export outer membrane protein